MKLIIAGGRDYELRSDHEAIIMALLFSEEVSEVVCGMAKGADLIGKDLADQCGISVKPFPANWNPNGIGIDYNAGPKRNTQMAQYADAVLLLPGGKGTNNMYGQAVKYKLKIYDLRFS